MTRPVVPLLIFGLSAFIAGCGGLIKELRCDPTVVGTTGFWAELGLSPNPGAAFLPLPSIRIGHGTIWRIGAHDNVTVSTGTETEVAAGGVEREATASPRSPLARGMGALKIEAKGSEGLKVLCGPPVSTRGDPP